MAHALEVDRDTVLAYRIGAHQLDRSADGLAVLDLGVAETPAGSARQSLAIRGAGLGDEITVWGARGAPFVHRADEVRALAAALRPKDEADAKARLGASSARVPGADLDAVRTAAEAMHDLVTTPMGKGDLSTALSARLPRLTYFCPGCRVDHLSDQLFRIAGLLGGVRIEPGTTPLIVSPIEGWSIPEATALPVEPYLRLHGPATKAEVAAYFAASRAAVEQDWPAGLVEVRVDGKPGYWIPAEQEAALRTPASPDFVRLLPPGDPYLQTRNRSLLVPDRAEQKALWRPLGNPGAVLADGEIVGFWRPKASGRKLTITVEGFRPIVEKLDEEAEIIATARGADDVRLVVVD
ncbi:DNA glycosylase AlkZ-like family protein [Cryptosporangium phraense]|uniref:Winged helix DNA-binding domain-containing protein n=1 Tax=Cryptosporangium phraense TaxID=2593070 RepID=A0A545AF80_9ACTN|nr:crosslink repair DNA glycosylase YcaQ family protein [Cryptosporangium phraense]TQS39981.1 winged helix DNA-binding domain-containing protein [Cryptosporangium phraense]